MTKQYFVSAVIAVLLLAAPANAQSAADLLQKGIHAQETVGDVDSAIQIFRQVAASPAANKVLAAQAQYQLVVCITRVQISCLTTFPALKTLGIARL